MRADAQRNRERLIEAAREVFREQGYDASLDEVAKRAGVGAGTLYRHFPSRDVLMDAIMQSWVDRVNDATDKVLVREGEPRAVLLEWFETYVALISLHKGGPAKITSAMGDSTSPIATKCQTLTAATERVVERLDAEHALKEDVEAVQLNRLVGGVAAVADNAGLDQAAVRPLLEVIADGVLA
jgi:AcrR family transcriptional regulator